MTPAPEMKFWPTVWLLLRSARRRSEGRKLRQAQLLNQRGGKNASSYGWLGTALGVLFMALVHGLAAGTLYLAIKAGERVSVEQAGKTVISQSTLTYLESMEADRTRYGLDRERLDLRSTFKAEARHLTDDTGAIGDAEAKRLRDEYLAHGTANFIGKDDAEPGFYAFAERRWHRYPEMLGSLVLLWWALMLMFQGEGLELDLQRRRHPMWEWLMSHPVPIGAVFFAEMLAPLAANPVYWTAPVFVAIVYGFAYGPPLGLLAAVVIGAPLAVAAGCMGKAIEIGVTLRVSPRQRGAVLGLMSWMGYASMMALFLGMFVAPKISTLALKVMAPLSVMPWPWLGLFMGLEPGGNLSFLLGLVSCWLTTIAVLAAAVGISVWGTKKGLSGAFGQTQPSAPGKSQNFGREPLYRKEFLWFLRDRSAIVQSILIPLTVAGVQLFNLRGIIRYAQGQWNYLCGAAIIFGTYFLWVLGPKSLASEGAALWIALTWPRGLENLLKAKAWLWSMISNALVAIILIYAAVLFPHDAWRIALVGAAWVLFGRSMAEKSVTLVTTTSESGEVQKLRGGTRAGAQIGMLTFAIGVLTQQWSIAVVGIVYSWLTAAAMWQNFRARLPYLYDPWSEEMPDPPTLVQSMVAISIMVEGAAVLTGILIATAGKEHAAVAQAASYALSAGIVSFATVKFMDNRGVTLHDVWVWSSAVRKPIARFGFTPSLLGIDRTFDEMMAEQEAVPLWKSFGTLNRQFLGMLLAGAAIGAALGLVGIGYTVVLEHLPLTAEMMRQAHEAARKFPEWQSSYRFMAILVAPFAEEYLFRGLLFRALDREWGGWKAVAGSAAFFAVYHPAMAWPMVFSLGAINALLFRKSRRLAPCVVLHLLYNAVILIR